MTDILKAQREALAKQNEEAMRRMEQSTPTPTQEENDRAKLGVKSLKDLDDKEPDGTDEVKEAAAQGAASYRTRDAAPAKK